MKWIAFNACGGLIWLAGLSFAKGAAFPNLLAAGENRLLLGCGIGLLGLMVLLWSNFRSAA